MPWPSDLIAYAKYNDFAGQTFNLDYIRDAGTPTIVTGGSPAIVSASKFGAGALALEGGAAERVDYTGANVVDAFIQTGTLEFFYRPNYTGTPSVTQYMCLLGDGHGSNNNLVMIYHTSGGLLFATWYTSAGTQIGYISYGWSVPSVAWYHISLNLDVTAGSSKLFLGGSQVGTTNTETGTRSGNAQLLRLGTSNTSLTGVPDFRVDDIRIFDVVQRTTAFTPPISELVDHYGIDIIQPAFLDEPLDHKSIDIIQPAFLDESLDHKIAAVIQTGTKEE